MTRNIIKPVTRNGPTWSVRTFDSDAIVYIAAVEAADGAAMPTRVPEAFNSFVVGCKADGTWAAIKAACFLAGPRTLAGSLVPLIGAAPTNFNFVSGDYAAKTGLKGGGGSSEKQIGTGWLRNGTPQNSHHMSAWISEPQLASTGFYIAAGSDDLARNGTLNASGGRSRGSFTGLFYKEASKLIAINRQDEAGFDIYIDGDTESFVAASSAPNSDEIFAFRRNTGTPFPTSARIAWYSIGEAINPALLDARLATYMTAINGATY